MDSMVGHENIKIVFIEALKVKLKKKKTGNEICAFPQKSSICSLFSLPVTQISLSPTPALTTKSTLDGWMLSNLNSLERFSKYLRNLL